MCASQPVVASYPRNGVGAKRAEMHVLKDSAVNLARITMVVLIAVMGSGFTLVQAARVVMDTGRTLPVPAHLMPVNPEAFQAAYARAKRKDHASIEHYAGRFPLTTESMVLGRQAAQRRDFPGMLRPMFLLGCDQTSVSWLRSREAALVERNSVGFVIQCRSLRLYRHLQFLFPALELTPVVGDQMAEAFQLTHYPVIVTREGITQ